MTKIIKLTLALLLTVSLGCAEAKDATKKKYPPYPEVWGYMLPMPKKGDRYSAIRPLKISNGDIHFTYVKKRERSIEKARFAMIGFFNREKRIIYASGYNKFWEENRDKEIKKSPPTPIIFSNGSSISLGGPGSFNCYTPFSVHLVRKDRKDRIVERKSLVYLLDTPDKRVLKPSCGNPEDAVVTLNVIGVSYLTFIKLEDDTFLAYNHRENFILRFNKKLKTKFPLNDRLFLIDTAVIEKIKQKAKQVELDKGDLAYYQYINDEVRNYVLAIKRRNRYGR